MVKAVTSLRISKDILNHFRTLNINLSDYVNTLIIKDLEKQSYNDTTLKRVVEIAEYEEKKSNIIQEMKLIGALRNASERVKNMSKGCEVTYHTLLKKNIELLELEYNFDYSEDTKFLIKTLYKEIQNINKEHFEPYKETKKLYNKSK